MVPRALMAPTAGKRPLRSFHKTSRCFLSTWNRGAFSSGSVAVLLSDATGVYSLSSTYAMGAGAVSIALLDVNGDKKLDLIALNRADKTMSIRLGAGDGT